MSHKLDYAIAVMKAEYHSMMSTVAQMEVDRHLEKEHVDDFKLKAQSCDEAVQVLIQYRDAAR